MPEADKLDFVTATNNMIFYMTPPNCIEKYLAILLTMILFILRLIGRNIMLFLKLLV